MLEWIGKSYMRMQKNRHEGRGLSLQEEGGFTLIELIVVVVIVGILAAIAIPIFLGQRARAADSRAKANVREAALATQVAYTEAGDAPGNAADAGTLLAEEGFKGSDPDVAIISTGGAADAEWCVITDSDGGEQEVWWMTQTNGAPVGGAAAAAPADCPAAPAP